MAAGRNALELFRRDAARWVRPEEIAALEDVTPAVVVRLLMRHRPLRAMAWFRLGQWGRSRGIRGVGGFVQRRLLRIYGLELAPSVPVGGGLYIAHPLGCVLHASSIGSNVSVISQVTFGTRGDAKWPQVMDDVFIGAGARVLGGITIGPGARIGANAVVISDVPPGATAVGVPARVPDRETAQR